MDHITDMQIKKFKQETDNKGKHKWMCYYKLWKLLSRKMWELIWHGVIRTKFRLMSGKFPDEVTLKPRPTELTVTWLNILTYLTTEGRCAQPWKHRNEVRGEVLASRPGVWTKPSLAWWQMQASPGKIFILSPQPQPLNLSFSHQTFNSSTTSYS